MHSAFVGCLQFAWVPVPQFPDVIILKFEGKVEELDELLDELLDEEGAAGDGAAGDGAAEDGAADCCDG